MHATPLPACDVYCVNHTRCHALLPIRILATSSIPDTPYPLDWAEQGAPDQLEVLRSAPNGVAVAVAVADGAKQDESGSSARHAMR